MFCGEWIDCEWARGEEGVLLNPWLGELLDITGEWAEFLKGKEEANVETGGTGKEGDKWAARPRDEERGSGLLLVLLLLGDPARGLCLISLNTLR